MKPLRCLLLTLLTFVLHGLGVEAARKPGDSVLLSDVKTLTLRKDLKTSHRRVSAVPQVRARYNPAGSLHTDRIL